MRGLRAAIGTVVVACASGLVTAAEQPPPAELLLVNASIVTMDPPRPRAQALAVRGDRIVALGTDAELAALRGPATRVMDAGGNFVMPGFIEGHGHFMALGESLGWLDLRTPRTWDAIVHLVKAEAANGKAGEWILGRGWHQEKWDSMPADAVEGIPVHASLSAVSPRNPVLLEHASGHGVFVNAMALQLAGIDDTTGDPPGGRIQRDAQGHATGWLIDSAADRMQAALAKASAERSPEEQRRLLIEQVQRAGREALSKGVMSFHDAGATFSVIDLYRELADAGRLPVRMYAMVGGESIETLEQNLARYRTIGYGHDFLTVRAIKRMLDGALGTRSAWLLEPYADDPGNTGLVVDPLDMIAKTAELATENGYQLNTHAIGDRANREILDLYERVHHQHPGRSNNLRWRVEHAQHLHPDDVPRFKQLGVIASMQGVHATSDGAWVAKRLGEQRARERTYVWRSLWDAGALITNGTDVPVEDIDPLACFRATVTRQMADGRFFYPEQKLTREEALATYTRNNAYAAFEEDLKGTLAVGKLADFIVLSHDLLAVPDAQLANVRVLQTVLGGRLVYTREP